jgi:catalase
VGTLGEEAVEAINGVYGRHAGYRAAHAKGVLCRGRFEATPEARALTTAAHMQSPGVEVTVRFSNASGRPTDPDFRGDLRGMATKFQLEDGSVTDLLAVTLPCFMVRTPEEFVEFTRAGRPSWARPFRVLAFLAGHGHARRGLWALATSRAVPSYASCRYNGIHAFRWIDEAGRGRYVRYSWLPDAAEGRGLSRRKAKRNGPDQLQRELRERLEGGPVGFRLQLQLGAEGDPVDDATAVWPAERETLVAGTLTLTELADGGDGLVFDPTRVTDGIELSPDPILRFRPQAYDVSYGRRSEKRAKVEAAT